MNLGTMKTALARIAGVDTGDPLLDWINAAMHEFEDAYPWPWLEAQTTLNTVAANPSVALPADYFKMMKIRIDTTTVHREIRYKSWTAFEEEVQAPATPGVPDYYTLVGASTIILYPVPNLVYPLSVTYEKAMADLAIDANVPDCPVRYHYTIVKGAVVYALEAESEEERASTARGVFEDAIDRHITRLGNKQSGGYNTVRDVQEYG